MSAINRNFFGRVGESLATAALMVPWRGVATVVVVAAGAFAAHQLYTNTNRDVVCGEMARLTGNACGDFITYVARRVFATTRADIPLANEVLGSLALAKTPEAVRVALRPLSRGARDAFALDVLPPVVGQVFRAQTLDEQRDALAALAAALSTFGVAAMPPVAHPILNARSPEEAGRAVEALRAAIQAPSEQAVQGIVGAVRRGMITPAAIWEALYGRAPAAAAAAAGGGQPARAGAASPLPAGAPPVTGEALRVLAASVALPPPVGGAPAAGAAATPPPPPAAAGAAAPAGALPVAAGTAPAQGWRVVQGLQWALGVGPYRMPTPPPTSPGAAPDGDG